MKRGTTVPVGGVSLLVIFAVLCLTVFAWLGLSSVLAEGRLCKASAEAVEKYYEADYAAEKILAELRGGQMPQGVVTVQENCYRYECRVSEVQVLEVEVELQNDLYTVRKWQLKSSAEWVPEDGVELWDGEL